MNGRYRKGFGLRLDFDLVAAKEIMPAFRVLEALDALELGGELGNQLHAIKCALKEDIIALQQAYIESQKYNICTECAMEINLHLNNHVPSHRGEGNLKHKTCPFLKADWERDR